jgi:methylated-DNA-[protein]-cysteine S-methyltransferase
MEHRATRGRLMTEAQMREFDAVVKAPFGAVGIRTEGVGTEDECVAEMLYLPPGTRAVAPKNRLAKAAAEQVEAYLRDPGASFELPLKPVGTRFQRRVWERIAAIPAGEVQSYGEVAKALRSGSRPVGQACGANHFPLAIPCHRVVASSGIGGFARGDGGFHLEIKRWLLAHEGVRL